MNVLTHTFALLQTPVWGPVPPNVIGGGGDFGQLIQHIFAAAGGANHATTPPMPLDGAHGGGRHRGAAARHARGPPRRHAHHSFYVGGAGPGAIHIGGSGPGGGVGGGPFLQELLQSLGATIQVTFSIPNQTLKGLNVPIYAHTKTRI